MYSCRTANDFLLPVLFVLVLLLATLPEQTSLASLKFWNLKWYSIPYTKLRQKSPPPGSPAEGSRSPPSGSPAEVNMSPHKGVNWFIVFGKKTSELTPIFSFTASAIHTQNYLGVGC